MSHVPTDPARPKGVSRFGWICLIAGLLLRFGSFVVGDGKIESSGRWRGTEPVGMVLDSLTHTGSGFLGYFALREGVRCRRRHRAAGANADEGSGFVIAAGGLLVAYWLADWVELFV